MWLTRLAAAAETTPPVTPPEIPYDQIGLVLVAIVGAISAVIVASIQRGNKTSHSAPAPTPPPAPAPQGSFVLSEAEWISVRDRLLKLETRIEYMVRGHAGHVDSSKDEHHILHADLDHIKRKLGI